MSVTLRHPDTGLEWETSHLPSTLLSLAEASEYGGKIYSEDGAVKVTAFEQSLTGHWYDQFVEMYEDGKDLDTLASKLDDEIDEVLSSTTNKIEREAEIAGVLHRLDTLEKGTLAPPNRDTITDPEPWTDLERDNYLRNLVGDLNAYPELSPDRWTDIKAVRWVGERLLQETRADLEELRHRYHFLTWRKALLEKAITNCSRWGDVRQWGPRKTNSGEQGNRHVKQTVEIGRALIEDEKTVPDFHNQKEEFKDWAGRVIGRSGSTAYNALKATNCYVTSNSGATTGLEKTIQNTKEFAMERQSSIEDFED